VYDTLDVCTRLGRYIIQELTGWHGRGGRWLATALTAGVPLFFVMQKTLDAKGNVVPAYKMFWSLFGASNQLLAALTLLGITVWLWRTRRAAWVWFVTGIPMVFMYVMSNWALIKIITANLGSDWLLSRLTADPLSSFKMNPILWVAVVLVGLALLMLVEAILVFVRLRPPPAIQPEPVGQPT
jgi:carbon starvation protein